VHRVGRIAVVVAAAAVHGDASLPATTEGKSIRTRGIKEGSRKENLKAQLENPEHS
jgi:hypothetical protein